MPTESIGDKRYFVTFIDDYSRACKVYIKHKASHQSSALFRALDVIRNNKITFNPQMHIFHVGRYEWCSLSCNFTSKANMQLSSKWHVLSHYGCKAKSRNKRNSQAKRKQEFHQIVQSRKGKREEGLKIW